MPIKQQIYWSSYIVTLKAGGRSREKSACNSILEYKDVDGIPKLPKWIFWAWEDGKGLTDEMTCNTNRYQIC
jgi:hypothetical protein